MKLKEIMRHGIILNIAVLLMSCSSANSMMFANTSTIAICDGLLDYPSINMWHPSRKSELAARGESCENYLEETNALELCDGILNLPVSAGSRKARLSEAAKRGESCAEYMHLKREPTPIYNSGNDNSYEMDQLKNQQRELEDQLRRQQDSQRRLENQTRRNPFPG